MSWKTGMVQDQNPWSPTFPFKSQSTGGGAQNQGTFDSGSALRTWVRPEMTNDTSKASSLLVNSFHNIKALQCKDSPKNPSLLTGWPCCKDKNKSEVSKVLWKGKLWNSKIVLLFVVGAFPPKKERKKSDRLQVINRKWFRRWVLFLQL